LAAIFGICEDLHTDGFFLVDGTVAVIVLTVANLGSPDTGAHPVGKVTVEEDSTVCIGHVINRWQCLSVAARQAHQEYEEAPRPYLLTMYSITHVVIVCRTAPFNQDHIYIQEAVMVFSARNLKVFNANLAEHGVKHRD